MAKDHYIELIGKAVLLLETLRDEPEGLSLQELAERTGFVKSSAHRILNSLKRHGYVEQESVGVPKPRYSAELGKKIAEHLKDACRRLSETLEAVGYIQ